MSRESGFRQWDGEEFIHFGPISLVIHASEDTSNALFPSRIPSLYKVLRGGNWNPEAHAGLKDKRDVDVYEGDLIDCQGSTRLVTFDRGAFRLAEWLPTEGIWEMYDLPVTGENLRQIDGLIVGNIHQNPHLVELPSYMRQTKPPEGR